jgi:hypothetical protein
MKSIFCEKKVEIDGIGEAGKKINNNGNAITWTSNDADLQA